MEYFNSRGFKVFVAFLDCFKAFDRISLHGLFLKLMDRENPLCFLLCLIYWYMNMTSSVKWENTTSRSFTVLLGIKQGGINSPKFFSIYLDDLTRILRCCHMYQLFDAAILFADDICLIAPTRSSLQELMDLLTILSQILP